MEDCFGEYDPVLFPKMVQLSGCFQAVFRTHRVCKFLVLITLNTSFSLLRNNKDDYFYVSVL